MRGPATLVVIVFAALVFSPTLAQDEIPQPAIDDKTPLPDARKAVYLMRQIDLTTEQASQVRGLIDSILKVAEPQPLDINQVRQLFQEIEKAKEEGDQAKVDELTSQLKQMSGETSDGSEFYDNLAPLLTDEQKVKLAVAQDRLQYNPSGSVRPVDLLRIVYTLNPTEAQWTKLRAAQDQMRKLLYPVMRPNLKKKHELLNYLHSEFRKALTAEQTPVFDLEVRRFRPDLTDEGLRVKSPKITLEEQPAASAPE